MRLVKFSIYGSEKKLHEDARQFGQTHQKHSPCQESQENVVRTFVVDQNPSSLDTKEADYD